MESYQRVTSLNLNQLKRNLTLLQPKKCLIAPTQGKRFSALAPASQIHWYALNPLVRDSEQALLQDIFKLVKIQ